MQQLFQPFLPPFCHCPLLLFASLFSFFCGSDMAMCADLGTAMEFVVERAARLLREAFLPGQGGASEKLNFSSPAL